MSAPNPRFAHPTPNLDFTVPNRVIVKESAKVRGVLSNYTLSDVLQEMQAKAPGQEATDQFIPLSKLHIDFTSGHMEASFIDSGTERARSYLVSSTAASQMSSYVLPSRFFHGLKTLARLDPQGANLATKTWTKFAEQQTEKSRLVRTIKMALSKNDIRWVIRSVNSEDYARYSHIEFARDVIKNGGDYSHMPVLSWTLTDNAVRIRFAAMHTADVTLGQFNPEALFDEPIPMIEAWNSETGCRRTGLRAGMFMLKNLSGLGHWSERAEHSWIHRGSTERIRVGVEKALHNLHSMAREVVEAYVQSREIEVEAPDAAVEGLAKGSLGEAPLEAIKQLLRNGAQSALPTTLSNVVDAMMATASGEGDIFDQEKAENAATDVLRRGLDLAAKSGGRLPFDLF